MKETLSLVISVLLVMVMAIPSFASWIQEEAYYDVAFSVNKAAAAWAPDGVYTPGEYFDIAVDTTWRSSACGTDANDDTAFNLDYKLALSWDENYFYTYIQFTDPNGHDNTYGADPANMWQAGALQINHADEDQMGESRLEYGIGLTSDTNEMITNVWADYLVSGFVPKANEDFIVTVDGDLVTYEARTPFTAFTTMEAKEGAIVSCCYVISWGNGTDYCHTQLAEGCTGNGKDAGAFAMVTLAGVGEVPVVEEPEPVVEEVVEEPAPAPVDEVVEEVTEEPAPAEEAPVEEVAEIAEEAPAAAVVVETAPQTFDLGIFAAIAAVISLAGVKVSKKR